MIRINLYLGGQKPKKGKRGILPAATEAGPGSIRLLLVLTVLVVGLLGAGVNASWYWKLKRDTDRIQADLRKADLDYARLAQVKARYQEREKQLQLYKRRLEVIDQLRASQFGPVKLLTAVGDTVNHTEDLWLSALADDGTNVNIKGVALNIHTVADLMRYLQNTGEFKAVEIKSSYQDEKVNDMQAFIFELNCQKQLAKTTAQPQQAPPSPPKKS
jgi:type IV pilus assembly protein PilN